MRFFLDHDIPVEIGRVPRREGHEVTELREVLPVTASDLDALSHAAERQLLLVTCNRDDYLALARERPNPGLIILIRRRSRQTECGNLLKLLREAGEQGVMGNINFA